MVSPEELAKELWGGEWKVVDYDTKRNRSMRFSITEDSLNARLEKARKQGALDFAKEVIKRIEFLEIAPAKNNLSILKGGIKDYIKELEGEKINEQDLF